MLHLDLEGTHYEIGRKLGEFFKEQKRAFPIELSKWQKERGIESLQLLEKFFPKVIDEIKGITETVNYDYELFGAWLMTMGCCLIMRENHNVEVRGCTAFCYTDNDKIYYGRDNDLPQYLKEVSKSIHYRPIGKNHFLLNTSSFTNGEEGINEHGLVVAMTFVVPNKEEVKPGFNFVFLVRYLLENCSTVKKSIEELQKLPIASSCNILLADKSKEMFVAECTPFEINLRRPETNAKGEKFIVTVNHFTSPKMQKYDRSRQNLYSSKARYETAYRVLNKADYNDALLCAKHLLSGKYGFMCQYRKIKFETIWSTIFDIVTPNMFLAEGNPEYVEYQERRLLIQNNSNFPHPSGDKALGRI